MKKIVFAFITLTIISCNSPSSHKQDSEDSTLTEQPKAQPELKLLTASVYDPSQLEFEGNIVKQKFWEDANGENIALFTQTERELFVYHYAVKENQAKLLRKVYDFEEVCEYDLFLEFIPESIGITDLDKDNLGELTFAYKKACISDVSPLDQKLLILENGDKYIIRGTTTVRMGPEIYEGEKNIDASFEKAPEEFLPHALEVWKKIE